MASEVLCGRCGALLTNPVAPCPRCGAPASGSFRYSPRPASRKNPWVAAGLALIPGMGHLYLGQNVKGMGFLFGLVGMQFIGLDLDLSVIGAAIGVPMELGGGTLWVYSIVDAYRTAKRMEAEAG
jgi:TM2 domain-containing membrane protein YozV